jgi:Secretion system C-terminal sorting domain
MKKICITIMALGMYGLALAQLPTQDPYPNAPAAVTNINQYALYIDSISTINQQVQNFAAAATNTTGALSVNLTGTTTGVHQLYVKVADINGKPSVINIGNFYMEGDNLYQNAPPVATNINKYNFYIDSVSNVNEQTQNFAAAATNTIAAQSINLTGVTTGVHQLYAKVTDVNGKPAVINVGNFYMEGDNLYQNTPPAATNINKYNFYIDSVTAINEQTQNFAAAATNTIASQAINLTGTTTGVHQLYAKVTDVNGKPSVINVGNFYMEGDNLYQNVPPAAVNINRYEFYIDSVTNVNIQPLSFTAGTTNTTVNHSIDLTGVLPVPLIHYLYARVYDINNIASIVNLGQFTMESTFRYQDVTAAAPALQNMEYYVDTDPGYGLATPIIIPGTNTTEVLSNISVALPGGLTAGTHIFHIRSKQNPWSIDNVIPFDVLITVPVNWLFVRAQLINNESLVSWATAQESNSSKYEIEHSTNNSSFTKLGEVTAAGNTSVRTNYSFTHTKPVSGFNYYRIKQIDNDGKFKYSEVVTVLKKDNLVQTIIAPNPVKEVLHVVETKETFIGTAEIYNAAGNLVLRKTINNKLQVYSLPVSNLASGAYVLKVIYKDAIKTYPFIKQ